MTLLALCIGVLLIGVIVQDAFEAMLLPQRTPRRWRLIRTFFRIAWSLWGWTARRYPDGPRRERFLSIFGPLSMMLLFTLWTSGLIFGFALIQWALQHAAGVATTFGDQAYLSGATFFTLGYGDVTPHGGLCRTIGVVEAGVGFGLLAIVIGYLPVLYQLFSRREAHVIQLDARAGSPPTASVMLRRHAESHGLDRLDEVLRAWELWCADLLESHISYPMLAYYRSQHEDQSWLGAVAAIMDTCALILIGVEDVGALQARMTFAMARQVVVELVRSLDLPGDRPRDAGRLDTAQYDRMIEDFAEAGLRWNGGPHAEQTLAAVRATYEPQLEALADYLLITLPDWTAGEDSPDHWERGPRGIIARRLVESLAEASSQTVELGGPLAARRRFRSRNRPKP